MTVHDEGIYSPGAGVGGPVALTLESCKEYVCSKIQKGIAVKWEKQEKVQELESDLKMGIAALKLQELGAEHFKRQYELEVAVSKHLQSQLGPHGV